MKKYTVLVEMTTCTYIEVEAESESKAIEAAEIECLNGDWNAMDGPTCTSEVVDEEDIEPETEQETKADQEMKGDSTMKINSTEFIKITPEELLQSLLELEDGESLDVGAWWDTTEEVCMWHKIVNISSTVQDSFGDTAPTYLLGYYGGHASTYVFCYDIEDPEGSIYTLTELLKTEDLLDGDGTVCMEVPSEE